MKKFSIFVLVLVAMFLAPLGSFAQTSKGTLSGTARDSTGAVLANATVTVIDQSTKQTRTAMTNAEGGYRFDALNPGPYTVVVTAPGFEKSEAKDVAVQSTVNTSYDPKVTVGKATDTVTVEANSATINTESGALAGVVNSEEIHALPVFSLSPYELATTVPGVQTVSNSGFSNGIDIQSNGSRPRANNFLLDGQEINDVSIGGQAFQPQIPDMFSSLNVLTNATSAEYGRAGGAIVNLVTKSGTNTYHGEAYERYTGSGLNALPYSLRGDTNRGDKARYDTHTYGFTAGGPIIRDKLFAFGGLELERYYGKETAGANLLPNTAGYATLTGITGATYNGVASNTVATQNALLQQYLSGGSYLTQDTLVTTLPSAAITLDTATANFLGCANPCVITENYFRRPPASTSNPDTQFTYKIDYTPWYHDSFSARYIHDRTSLTPDFGNNGNALVNFDTLQGGPSELGEGTWTHVFNSHLLNEFRASETRLNFQFAPTPQTQANPLFALNTLSIGGFPALGPNQNFPQGRGEDLYQFQDTVGFTTGRNSFRFGVDIGRQLEKDLVSQNAKGTLSFASDAGTKGLGNFLLNQLGANGSATKTFGPTRIDPHNWRTGIFAQDDIKLSADLTINLGVRYDYLTNGENALQYPGIDPNNIFGNPINTFIPIKNDFNNIAPRFGFAFNPHSGLFSDGKTVIRGGFGIFYDSSFSNIIINAAQSSPNAVGGLLTSTAVGGLANATNLIGSITPTLNPLSTVTSVVNNIVNPQTLQYNVGIERELPYSTTLAVRYVGERGLKLFANQQYNYFNGVTGTRLNTTRGAIVARGNFADSNYNGLQVEGTHNFSHGFSIRANYVFSKDLDDGSEVFTTTGSSTSYTANLAPGGRRQDYGPSAYDHRQYGSIAYVLSPKGFHSENAVLNGVYGVFTRHLTISGVQQFQSGIYSTITTGVDTNGDGSSANDRPIIGNAAAPYNTAGIDGHFVGGTPGQYYDECNYSGGVNPITKTCSQAAQPASNFHFVTPYGTANQFLLQEIGRNSSPNFGSITTNIAVEKGIGLSYLHFERGTINLRAEVQNLGNHNDAGVLDTSLVDIPLQTGQTIPSFQNINASRFGGRSMILWARLVF